MESHDFLYFWEFIQECEQNKFDKNNCKNPLHAVIVNDNDHDVQYVIASKFFGNFAGSICPIDNIAGNNMEPTVTINLKPL